MKLESVVTIIVRYHPPTAHRKARWSAVATDSGKRLGMRAEPLLTDSRNALRVAAHLVERINRQTFGGFPLRLFAKSDPPRVERMRGAKAIYLARPTRADASCARFQIYRPALRPVVQASMAS